VGIAHICRGLLLHVRTARALTGIRGGYAVRAWRKFAGGRSCICELHARVYRGEFSRVIFTGDFSGVIFTGEFSRVIFTGDFSGAISGGDVSGVIFQGAIFQG
jgi:hypothetical protein